MGQIQSLEDLVSFLIRRRFVIGLVALLGIVLSVTVAKLRPDSYESAATIQVQGAQIVGETEDATGSAQLMQTIEQQLTTRDALIAVMERHGLYSGLPLNTDQKVALLRSSIRFQGVASVSSQTFGAPANLSAIIIFARMGEAEQAARVANDLAQSILDLSSVGTADKARETYAFYQIESARVAAEMERLETEVANYKNANAAALPTLVEARRDELISIETEIRDLDQQLLALAGEDAALAANENLRVTDRRRQADLRRQIGVLTDQRTALATQQAEIETAIAETPEVERQLSGYSRQLQQLQEQFQVVARRLAEAETTQRLAVQQQGERFAMLERATTPIYPTGSGGKKIAVAGAVASVIAALALAFVLDLMNPVVRTSAQMERQLGLRPVIAIPDLQLSGHRDRKAQHALADLRGNQRALPRFVVLAGGTTILLLAASALV